MDLGRQRIGSVRRLLKSISQGRQIALDEIPFRVNEEHRAEAGEVVALPGPERWIEEDRERDRPASPDFLNDRRERLVDLRQRLLPVGRDADRQDLELVAAIRVALVEAD